MKKKKSLPWMLSLVVIMSSVVVIVSVVLMNAQYLVSSSPHNLVSSDSSEYDGPPLHFSFLASSASSNQNQNKNKEKGSTRTGTGRKTNTIRDWGCDRYVCNFCETMSRLLFVVAKSMHSLFLTLFATILFATGPKHRLSSSTMVNPVGVGSVPALRPVRSIIPGVLSIGNFRSWISIIIRSEQRPRPQQQPQSPPPRRKFEKVPFVIRNIHIILLYRISIGIRNNTTATNRRRRRLKRRMTHHSWCP